MSNEIILVTSHGCRRLCMKGMSNKYLEVTTRSAFAESSFIPVLVEPCEELISRDTSQQWAMLKQYNHYKYNFNG